MGVGISRFREMQEWEPKTDEKPTFDESYGFTKPRRPRVMVATPEEMKASKIPLDKRDYCAHYLIEYHTCARRYFPFPVMCKPEKHQYLDCEYEDHILRMKEYEREKRLRLRKMRLEAQ